MVTDFSLGFAKGVPKGTYEWGKGSLLYAFQKNEQENLTAEQKKALRGIVNAITRKK